MGYALDNCTKDFSPSRAIQFNDTLDILFQNGRPLSSRYGLRGPLHTAALAEATKEIASDIRLSQRWTL